MKRRVHVFLVLVIGFSSLGLTAAVAVDTRVIDVVEVTWPGARKAPADATAPTKAPLTNRKEKKKACGRKPLNKTKKAEWQKCVDAGGTASFEGDFDSFEKDYIDFEGEVDNQFMYSDFDNSLNLDL